MMRVYEFLPQEAKDLIITEANTPSLVMDVMNTNRSANPTRRPHAPYSYRGHSASPAVGRGVSRSYSRYFSSSESSENSNASNATTITLVDGAEADYNDEESQNNESQNNVQQAAASVASPINEEMLAAGASPISDDEESTTTDENAMMTVATTDTTTVDQEITLVMSEEMRQRISMQATQDGGVMFTMSLSKEEKEEIMRGRGRSPLARLL
jgi:hypothetical protein